jgi:hypothetical protein
MWLLIVIYLIRQTVLFLWYHISVPKVKDQCDFCHYFKVNKTASHFKSLLSTNPTQLISNQCSGTNAAVWLVYTNVSWCLLLSTFQARNNPEDGVHLLRSIYLTTCYHIPDDHSFITSPPQIHYFILLLTSFARNCSGAERFFPSLFPRWL